MGNNTNESLDALSALNVTRGDASMMYGLSGGSYTLRFHLKLDQPIDPDKMRIAVDKTAERYPYLCVSLKKNASEYYYEKNDAPVVLLHTREQVTLNSEETNGHTWAVCYDEDSLFLNFYHGRTDGTGAYFLISTLLYYYLEQQYDIPDRTGIRTLDTPVSEREIYDPVNDLPVVDLTKFKRPPVPAAINLMEASKLQPVDGKGIVLKLMIPEKSFMIFSKENDASPGIMLCALMARAVRRIHPDIPESVVAAYVVNARPMLHAEESFHNCVNRVILEYDDKISAMSLEKQCMVFRGKTMIQSDEEKIKRAMTISGSMAQMLFGLPDLNTKAQVARKTILGILRATSYTVSYVGKWKFPQLGEHIREFWVETPIGSVPLLELSAVNGQFFISILQSCSDRVYYDALLEELKEQGITYTECGESPICTPDIIM